MAQIVRAPGLDRGGAVSQPCTRVLEREKEMKRFVGMAACIGLFGLALLTCGAHTIAHPAVAAADSGLDEKGHLRAVALAPSGFAYVRLSDGVQIRARGITKNIIFYGPDAVA